MHDHSLLSVFLEKNFQSIQNHLRWVLRGGKQFEGFQCSFPGIKDHEVCKGTPNIYTYAHIIQEFSFSTLKPIRFAVQTDILPHYWSQQYLLPIQYTHSPRHPARVLW